MYFYMAAWQSALSVEKTMKIKHSSNKARKPLLPVATIPKTLARFWNHFAQRYGQQMKKLISVTLFLLSTPALACTCDGTIPTQKHYTHADLVAHVKVVTTKLTSNQPKVFNNKRISVFQILESYKDVETTRMSDKIIVLSNNSLGCLPSIEKNSELLIFATLTQSSAFHIEGCNGTTHILNLRSDNRAYIDIFRKWHNEYYSNTEP